MMNITGIGGTTRNRLNDQQLKKAAQRVGNMIKRNKLETELKSVDIPKNIKLKDYWNPSLKSLIGLNK